MDYPRREAGIFFAYRIGGDGDYRQFEGDYRRLRGMGGVMVHWADLNGILGRF